MVAGFKTVIAFLSLIFSIGHPAPQAFVFQHDGILGTSLDLAFVTPVAADAEQAERIALAEIERLRLIISTWDSTSEISRLTTALTPAPASMDLLTVLHAYTDWNARSGQAYSATVGSLVALWRAAQRADHLPDSVALARAVHDATTMPWRIDDRAGIVTIDSHASIDLNSLGKGYIIDRVVAAVRERVPSLRGGVVNIGGDVRVWGESTAPAGWRIAVTDPRRHADNAAPLTQLLLTDRAVSSSGDYARGFDIGGRHWSHIIDPRTGYPADQNAGVTVVAGDNATANALATTLSVLPADEGLRLVAATPGAEALIVAANGEELRSPGFARYEVAAPAPRTAPGGPVAAFVATIAIDITPKEPNRHRPYVAVWITDTASTRHVRTLAFWGSKPKYQRELSRWWGQFGGDYSLVDAVTRATRSVGQYTLEWDGLMQDGSAAASGPYRFWLEEAFEDGAHSIKSVVVTCSGARASGSIPGAAAFAGAQVECLPPTK